MLTKSSPRSPGPRASSPPPAPDPSRRRRPAAQHPGRPVHQDVPPPDDRGLGAVVLRLLRQLRHHRVAADPVHQRVGLDLDTALSTTSHRRGRVPRLRGRGPDHRRDRRRMALTAGRRLRRLPRHARGPRRVLRLPGPAVVVVAAFSIFAANMTFYLYTPELFPNRSRALGCSTGGVFNRLGVILGPMVVASSSPTAAPTPPSSGLGRGRPPWRPVRPAGHGDAGKTLEQPAPGGPTPPDRPRSEASRLSARRVSPTGRLRASRPCREVPPVASPLAGHPSRTSGRTRKRISAVERPVDVRFVAPVSPGADRCPAPGLCPPYLLPLG